MLQIAGQFAKRLNAKNLFLNHFSARYIDAGSTLDISAGKSNDFDLNTGITVLCPGLDRSRDYSSGVAEEKERRIAALRKIEDQAAEAWGANQRAVATRDFMTVAIKRRKN